MISPQRIEIDDVGGSTCSDLVIFGGQGRDHEGTKARSFTKENNQYSTVNVQVSNK
jgi:hypothetical protein